MKKKKKKGLTKIEKFLYKSCLVIIALLVIILFIFLINNKNSIIEKAPIRILVIKSNSMYPKLKINDIIIIKKSNNYNVKDIITYSTDNEVLITHRIVKSCEGGFITKGDNNNSEDNELVKLENIKGKVILRINRNYQILMVLLFIVLVFFVFF